MVTGLFLKNVFQLLKRFLDSLFRPPDMFVDHLFGEVAVSFTQGLDDLQMLSRTLMSRMSYLKREAIECFETSDLNTEEAHDLLQPLIPSRFHEKPVE